ncbi:hypothetical protein PLICRDRAFT_32804 [Plicaturopsis crispa FD-325 SS-3]|uniref:Uncharacterized protein n=1 Tax=Plicaturopsis crispa FD-325 SS-3 TaxID=944288 RepID=A0A0C9SKE4_PLICR|nr:hypothetical protein PLICRDRAFT_32804 [Plicaturopsis crispa FD-325 SS-3]
MSLPNASDLPDADGKWRRRETPPHQPRGSREAPGETPVTAVKAGASKSTPAPFPPFPHAATATIDDIRNGKRRSDPQPAAGGAPPARSSFLNAVPEDADPTAPITRDDTTAFDDIPGLETAVAFAVSERSADDNSLDMDITNLGPVAMVPPEDRPAAIPASMVHVWDDLTNEQRLELQTVAADQGFLRRQLLVNMQLHSEHGAAAEVVDRRLRGIMEAVRDSQLEVNDLKSRTNRVVHDSIRYLRESGETDATIRALFALDRPPRQPVYNPIRITEVSPSPHAQSIIDESSPTRVAVDREISPMRANETLDQFEDRADTQIRRTAQSLEAWRGSSPLNRPETTTESASAPPTRPRSSSHVTWATGDLSHDPPSIRATEYNTAPARMDRDRGVPRTLDIDGISQQSLAHDRNTGSRMQDLSGLYARPAGHESRIGSLLGDEASVLLHGESLLGTIRTMIDQQVGQAGPPLPVGAKHPRIKEPVAYDGSDSHDMFINWLVGFLTWLRSHNVRGPESDEYRCMYMASYLSDEAKEWYNREVNNPLLPDRPTRFSDIVCAMHIRFVHSATARKATEDYEKCSYSPSGGVDGFYMELLKFASRMIEYPTSYDVRRRFMTGLPVSIHNSIIQTRGMSAEHSGLKELRLAAYQIEQSRTLLRSQEAARGAPLARPPQRARTPALASGPIVAATAARPTNNVRDGPRPPRDATNIECFTCHTKGHYSNDPACPKFSERRIIPGPRRLNAQRVVDPDDPDYIEDYDDGDEVNSWGGSQYEPDDQDIDTYPPYEDVAPVRVGGMRITMMTADKMPVQMNTIDLVHLANISRRQSTGDVSQPVRTRDMQITLTAEVDINGVPAYTLFDSGSTTDSISRNSLGSALGCAGSKSKISYFTRVPVKIGPISEDVNFDLVNLDRYDCIVGTPFMNKHNVCLDFGARLIRIGNDSVAALSVPAERAIIAKCPPPTRKPWDKTTPDDVIARPSSV